LVKQWAKRRGLVDPTRGRLNSFAWALMAIFYVQVEHPELVQAEHARTQTDAAYWRWVERTASEAAERRPAGRHGSAEVSLTSLGSASSHSGLTST